MLYFARRLNEPDSETPAAEPEWAVGDPETVGRTNQRMGAMTDAQWARFQVLPLSEKLAIKLKSDPDWEEWVRTRLQQWR